MKLKILQKKRYKIIGHTLGVQKNFYEVKFFYSLNIFKQILKIINFSV